MKKELNYMSEIIATNNEVALKIARRQKYVEDLARIVRRLEVLSEEIWTPERFTAKEYESRVNEYKNLEFEYEVKERNFKNEFSYKDIENELERITKQLK
jgi:hypothetical protein